MAGDSPGAKSVRAASQLRAARTSCKLRQLSPPLHNAIAPGGKTVSHLVLVAVFSTACTEE